MSQDLHGKPLAMDAEAARLLDVPVWSSLTGGHRALAEPGPLARRFPPEVSPFAAIALPSAEAFEALHALLPPNGRLALVTAEPAETPLPSASIPPIGARATLRC